LISLYNSRAKLVGLKQTRAGIIMTFGVKCVAIRGGREMRLLLLLAVILGAGAYVTYTASQKLWDGTPWAHNVCSATGPFCQHPEWLAYGAVGFLVLALLGFAVSRA
jgi:hypothetical protein